MKRRFALFAALLLAPMGQAMADGVNVGVLTCVEGQKVGLVVTAKVKLNCSYQPSDGSPAQIYTGAIREFGVELGVTEETEISWSVIAPGSLKPGALEGTYTGVSGSATAGAGAGANMLVGGFDRSVALQPASVQVQSGGVSVAAAVSAMTLEFQGE